MAEEGYLLSESHYATLLEMIREFRGDRQNALRHYRPDADHLPPEVYVALTPPGGIPARSGTTPGSATCTVYRVLDGVLADATASDRVVYNLSTTAVAADEYIPIERDKWGTWLALTAGGGGGDAGCVGCDGCGWMARMHDDWCFLVEVVSGTGQFAAIDTTQFVYAPADGNESSGVLDWGGGSGTALVQLWDGHPRLLLDGLAVAFDCCGDGTAYFRGGPGTGHTGSGTPADLCESDEFCVKVTCTCCPIDGWDGEGWYCVTDNGSSTAFEDCSPVYLLEADRCDHNISICSGPYASESEAENACPPPDPGTATSTAEEPAGTGSGPYVESCCSGDDPLPEILYIRFFNGTGTCTCLNGIVAIMYASGSPVDIYCSEGIVNPCGEGEPTSNFGVCATCSGGSFGLELGNASTGCPIGRPVYLTGTLDMSGFPVDQPCQDTIDFEITEVPP